MILCMPNTHTHTCSQAGEGEGELANKIVLRFVVVIFHHETHQGQFRHLQLKAHSTIPAGVETCRGRQTHTKFSILTGTSVLMTKSIVCHGTGKINVLLHETKLIYTPLKQQCFYFTFIRYLNRSLWIKQSYTTT